MATIDILHNFALACSGDNQLHAAARTGSFFGQEAFPLTVIIGSALCRIRVDLGSYCCVFLQCCYREYSIVEIVQR